MEKKGEITKQRIINSALSLFGNKGYDKTTMADIMKDTGLSKGALYHHFVSKENIADIGIHDFADTLEISFTEILKKPHSALEKLKDLMISKQAIYGDNEKALMSILASQKSAQLKEKMQLVHREKFVLVMEEIIRQGQSEGTFNTKDEPEAVAHFIFVIDESFYRLPADILNNPNKVKPYYVSGMRIICNAMGIREDFFNEFVGE